jgi:hypothetical protein
MILISGHIVQALRTAARSLPATRELHTLATGT